MWLHYRYKRRESGAMAQFSTRIFNMTEKNIRLHSLIHYPESPSQFRVVHTIPVMEEQSPFDISPAYGAHVRVEMQGAL